MIIIIILLLTLALYKLYQIHDKVKSSKLVLENIEDYLLQNDNDDFLDF